MTAKHQYDNWETVAVTALPAGWRNVYKHDDGTLTTWPCPAVLLQEHRSVTTTWDEPTSDGKGRICQSTKALDPPYETRAVLADVEFGSLVVAADTANYAGSAAPGEDPRDYAA